MDGGSLIYKLRNLLRETSTSSFLDTRTSYDYIYEAVKKFGARVKCLTATQSITTVANQSSYDLNADFQNLYFRNDRSDHVIKYTNASNEVYWIPYRGYEYSAQANNTTSIEVPSTFAITDNQTITDRVTGNATANGTLTFEESALTCANSFANVCVGDSIHNSNDSSHGLVVSKTSNSVLVTTLFGGTSNAWTVNDIFIIVPQGRKKIVVDPPTLTANETITIEYLQVPPPVYSSYRTYRIDSQYEMAIVYYAAWLYKYRDIAYDEGDRWYKAWDEACRRAIKEANRQLGRGDFRVNLTRKSLGDRSFR